MNKNHSYNNINPFTKVSHSLFSREWCDVVFDQRNKAYGAYRTRARAGRRYACGLLVVAGLLLCASAPLVALMIMTRSGADDTGEIKHLVQVSGIRLKEARPMRRPPQKEKPELGETQSKEQPEIEQPEDVVTVLRPEDVIVPEEIEDLPDDSLEVILEERQLELAKNDEQTEGVILTEVPEFPDGGIKGFMKWLEANMVYPPACVRSHIEGTVEVAFVVMENGEVEDIRILKKAAEALNHEALRVLGTMPNWKPGHRNGQPQKAQVTLPIVFALSE